MDPKERHTMWRVMFANSLMTKAPTPAEAPVAPEVELTPIAPDAWRAWAAADAGAPKAAPAEAKAKLVKAARSA